MSETPIYDQLLWERANPVMIAPQRTELYNEKWQEIGYLTTGGLESPETPENQKPLAKINHQETTVRFELAEMSEEALNLFHGYDIKQLHETTLEWIERETPPAPRFKRAWITSSRRMPIPANQIQDIATQSARVAGASAKDIVNALQKLGAYETHRRTLGDTK